MTSKTRCDVVIIGTGAGGGTLAHRLAPSGKRILLLERGSFVPREKDNWDPRAVNVEGRYQAKDTWKTTQGEDLHPHTNYWVGGNTKIYGAALFRLRREDFGELRHRGGLSPAWPISYDDLEPYYTQRRQHRARLPSEQRGGTSPAHRATEGGDEAAAALPAPWA